MKLEVQDKGMLKMMLILKNLYKIQETRLVMKEQMKREKMLDSKGPSLAHEDKNDSFDHQESGSTRSL